MCVRAYGANPNNSATLEGILNLITYLKRYWNLLSEYVNEELAGYFIALKFDKIEGFDAKTIRNAYKMAYNVNFLVFLNHKMLLKPIIIKKSSDSKYVTLLLLCKKCTILR